MEAIIGSIITGGLALIGVIFTVTMVTEKWKLNYIHNKQ